MANIKWSGIEKTKYGLTARWYVSAYYGNDNDTDDVGLYDPNTNVTGHGGKTRPFATLDKWYQETATSSSVVVIDGGVYSLSVNVRGIFIGDGNVVFDSSSILNSSNGIDAFYNLKIINSKLGGVNTVLSLYDCFVAYSTLADRSGTQRHVNNVYVETNLSAIEATTFENNLLIRSSGSFTNDATDYVNCMFIDCDNLTLRTPTSRPIGTFKDYSVIIGTIKTSSSINSKTTGVTIEDFKTDGNYFVKSYSEVDLWGNESGAGATVAQLQELFCNYFSPIYIDTWNEVNLHLKTTAPDILKYGGLNGTYIGALPVMHWFTAADLWDTYRDTDNTTNLEKSSVTGAIHISDSAEYGTFRSTRIDLPKAITADTAMFFANLVYNIEGTVKQGVSNQRIDTTTDLQPDNTANQRVVYDFKMAVAASSSDELGAFKNYELDREPTIDANSNSHLDDNFDSDTETKQTIQSFMVEFTLRKVVIE